MIKLTSYNCKNIKTCGNSISEILKDNDIILIQEHWLFHSQTSIISDINSDINFVAKGVDINDPLLPVSLPRGYGGVAFYGKKTLITLSEPYQTAPKKSNVLNLKVQREM